MAPQASITVHQTTAKRPVHFSDQDRLQRLSQSDIDAFWGLWESYRRELLSRHCLRWMGGKLEDAEDALSSAGLKALEYLTTHDVEITNVKHWLQRLLHNHCMDIRKRQKKYVDLSLDNDDASPINEPVSTLVWTSPEHNALRSELRQALHDAINHLPSRLREPARLRFVSEMSHCDIALKLNLCPANVRKRIQHARPLLQAHLQAYFSDARQPDAAQPAVTLPSHRDDKPCVEPASPPEISAQYVALRLLHIRTANGRDHHLPVALDVLPTRLHQKLATLRAYVERHPTGWKRHLALADLIYLTGDWEAAISTYRHVLKKKPRCLHACLRLGQMLHGLHRDQEALAVYQQALSSAQHTATQHHLQGLRFACQHQLHEAATAFAAARELEPDNIAHSHALGFTQLQANQPQHALQAYDTVLAYHPDDPVALTYSYDALYALGQWPEAQQRVARALEIDPKNVLAIKRQVEYRLNRGLLNGEDGRDTDILVRRALYLAPQAPEVQALSARIHSGSCRATVRLIHLDPKCDMISPLAT
ncbi:MAG: sigma-70 family RNA polymerase sigma factor [Candidatus Tectomicrobia bacterium]|nr:sigma-70 family RNA polymerase sigma factor [Candidatus Tectomicrobia bacterium]